MRDIEKQEQMALLEDEEDDAKWFPALDSELFEESNGGVKR